MDDETLTRLAAEEILRETKRAAVRADIAGPQGWLKSKIPSTNKRFLRNTILSTMQDCTKRKDSSKAKSHMQKIPEEPINKEISNTHSNENDKKTVIESCNRSKKRKRDSEIKESVRHSKK